MGTSILVAGAGFTGATVARLLAEAGHHVTVKEARDHVAGNCHTSIDAATGVMVHRYGPHILHTSDEDVWAFLNRFSRFRDYRHVVRSVAGGQVYSLPLNLHTLNQFFGLALNPDQARALIAAEADQSLTAPRNFEEKALSLMGRRLYEAFFKGYTEKQWGCPATDLPAAILDRLPLRFNYDDGYFTHRHQAMPEAGYTALVAAMLDHPRIDLHLNNALAPTDAVAQADHLCWTGPIDGFFGHRFGRLSYRSLAFEEFRAADDGQGCAVLNQADAGVAHTRTTEHRHLSPWREVQGSVLFREYSRDCGPQDVPYYPVRLLKEQEMLARYEEQAAALPDVSFIGRLGSYRYLDMDKAVRHAMDVAEALIARFNPGRGAGR